jgi:hypothetical protein
LVLGALVSTKFRTGDYEEIMNKASSLSLLSNAVVVWNTIAIGNIVGQLRAAGEQIDDADLSKTSPLARRHVIPNGTYFLGSRQPVTARTNPGSELG